MVTIVICSRSNYSLLGVVRNDSRKVGKGSQCHSTSTHYPHAVSHGCSLSHGWLFPETDRDANICCDVMVPLRGRR